MSLLPGKYLALVVIFASSAFSAFLKKQFLSNRESGCVHNSNLKLLDGSLENFSTNMNIWNNNAASTLMQQQFVVIILPK